MPNQSAARWTGVPRKDGARRQAALPCSARQCETLPVSVTAPKNAAWGFKDLFCTATMGKAGGECYHTICVARRVIADLTADIRGIPTAMTLTNRSAQPQTVEARLVGDGNVQDTDWRTLTVPAKGAKSVAIAPKYTTPPTTWSDLFVEIKRDGKLERNALCAWNCAVWNGSFEMHSPGSTMPDFWSLIDYSGKEDGAKSYPWPNWMTNMPRTGNTACVSTHIAGMSRISPFVSIRRLFAWNTTRSIA